MSPLDIVTVELHEKKRKKEATLTVSNTFSYHKYNKAQQQEQAF